MMPALMMMRLLQPLGGLGCCGLIDRLVAVQVTLLMIAVQLKALQVAAAHIIPLVTSGLCAQPTVQDHSLRCRIHTF
jgi:hypothetical protein